VSPIFRPDRARKAVPHLEWRVALFVAGAAFGLAGIYLDEGWLRLVAIALLAAGALVRFVPGGNGS